MKNKLKIKIEELTFEQKIAFQKIRNERFNSAVEIVKWIVISIGAIISFLIIDVGNLKVEEFKADTGHEENLLQSYLESTNTPDPDLWRRKLRLIYEFSADSVIIKWAKNEEEFIKNKAALLALYKETIGIASILANRNLHGTEDWTNASKRFYQLYWADLPFYGETQPVVSAMINFKLNLDRISDKTEQKEWKDMDNSLIQLSKTLKVESNALEEK